MRPAPIIAAALIAIASASAAFAADAFTRPNTGDAYFPLRESPQCTDPAMLKQIVRGFAHKAENQLHRPDLGIADITAIHQHRYLPQDAELARPIPRRYCGATAWLTDGSHRDLWYLIEGGAGFASIGSKASFCVEGFDRWNVYNADCRLLR